MLELEEIYMEKIMLAIGKFKEGEGHFEKFMGFMQSEEGMAERRKVAHVEKTVPGVFPDKSGVMFKVHVHDEQAMKDFVTGRNPVMKPIYDECIQSIDLFELTPVSLD
tara:strand:+ start:515 stop:838 length:324 start_codon:yes stop_codon:yes gene_type:complete